MSKTSSEKIYSKVLSTFISELTSIVEEFKNGRGYWVAFNVRDATCYPTDAVRAGGGARRGAWHFFRVAKDLYGLASINYVCINISVNARARYFMHCVYTDACVKQFASNDAIQFEMRRVIISLDLETLMYPQKKKSALKAVSPYQF